MTIYYLMVKTHNTTGLKYLCQTTRNPDNYRGSGIDWKTHLTKFGSLHNTEVIQTCASRKELTFWGKYYSKLWNIVDGQDDFGNKIWANRIPETGGGGNLNTRADGTSIQTDKVLNGIHPWMKRPDGTSLASDRVKNGTNPFLKRGSANHNADKTLYTFKNIVTGEIIIMAQRDFVHTYKLKQSNINKVINGHRKSAGGWMLG